MHHGGVNRHVVAVGCDSQLNVLGLDFNGRKLDDRPVCVSDRKRVGSQNATNADHIDLNSTGTLGYKVNFPHVESTVAGAREGLGTPHILLSALVRIEP